MTCVFYLLLPHVFAEKFELFYFGPLKAFSLEYTIKDIQTFHTSTIPIISQTNPLTQPSPHTPYIRIFFHNKTSLSIFSPLRVTIAFFAVCGLDILDSLDLLPEDRKQQVIDWVYRHQVAPDVNAELQCGGFQGSSTINIKGADETCGSEKYKWGHLAMTYTGIAILVTLGDDLNRLNRRAIIDGVAAVQRTDGSFSASVEGNEHDMRFVYCAAAICYMLDDWGKVDKLAMAQYIQDSIVSMVLLCMFYSNTI